MKNKKMLAALLCCLLVTLSTSLLAGVRADNPLISRSNASRFLSGGFASGTYTYNNQEAGNGYFQVNCNGNSYCCFYAYADSSSFTGSTGSKSLNINVQVDSTSSSGTGSHTIYLKFIDASTGQTLFSSTTSDWNVFTGLNDIHAYPTVTLTNGHTYELQVGPYVQTSGTQTAQAIGTITQITVTWT